MDGVCHYRVVTEIGQHRLIPQWMCEPEAFDPSPVEYPVIDPVALLDLHRLVSSAISSLRTVSDGVDQEERSDDTVESVPTRGSD